MQRRDDESGNDDFDARSGERRAKCSPVHRKHFTASQQRLLAARDAKLALRLEFDGDTHRRQIVQSDILAGLVPAAVAGARSRTLSRREGWQGIRSSHRPLKLGLDGERRSNTRAAPVGFSC
jgi:hypothetical protein